jgi:hypothetical protein
VDSDFIIFLEFRRWLILSFGLYFLFDIEVLDIDFLGFGFKRL